MQKCGKPELALHGVGPKAVRIINELLGKEHLRNGVKQENLEEVIVHELLHIKLYPLDQVCYSLITSNFEELTKCFLLAFGENKQFSYGRCAGMKSYNELFDGLKPLE